MSKEKNQGAVAEELESNAPHAPVPSEPKDQVAPDQAPSDQPSDATLDPEGKITSEEPQPQVGEPLKVVMGEIVIKVGPEGMSVSHPQNLLIALAVLDAGRLFIEMKYTDALKASIANQPKILRPGDAGYGLRNMMDRLGKPS